MAGENTKNYHEQGGDRWVVGGVLNVVGDGQIQKDGVPVDLGGGGSITSDDITDATAVGKAVLTAGDAAAARTAIGAGTSNLQLGSDATQAAAGNHTHTASVITATPVEGGTATDVQGILEELAQRIAALEDGG